MDTEKRRRRTQRHERNITKQRIEQETSGKLIEENHNGYDYSREYTDRAISWYHSSLYFRHLQLDPIKFGELFMKGYRVRLQTLLLHWPDNRERDWSFYFFKQLLDLYRESGPNGLWKLVDETYKNKGIVCG